MGSDEEVSFMEKPAPLDRRQSASDMRLESELM
jgi:hypothetical protein